MSQTPAHDQKVTHRYIVRYPAHDPREGDPHYKDFSAFHRRTKDTARCGFAIETNDDTECDHDNPLELHHGHVEFALLNEIDLTRLNFRYPGVGDPDTVGAWVESATNLVWLCRFHHRGVGGVHYAAVADYEAEHFVRHLITGISE
jgi:hypothetical protein